MTYPRTKKNHPVEPKKSIHPVDHGSPAQSNTTISHIVALQWRNLLRDLLWKFFFFCLLFRLVADRRHGKGVRRKVSYFLHLLIKKARNDHYLKIPKVGSTTLTIVDQKIYQKRSV
jgi:hypothetical protein